MSFCGGFIIGAQNSPIYAKPTENLLLTRENEVQLDFATAVSTLSRCLPFQREFPTAHAKLRTDFIRGFGYVDRGEAATVVYAYVIEAQKTIVLTPLFFQEDAPMRASIMGHEILHLLGMPKHSKPLNESLDVIYLTVSACFPGY